MLSIDLESAAGTRLGSGPLSRIARWERVRRLDRGGHIAWDMPLGDVPSSPLALRRYARAHALRGHAIADLGLGIVDTIETDADARLVTASGDDLMRELAMRPAGPLVLKSPTLTAPLPLLAALLQIQDAANAAPAPAWTFDVTTWGSVGSMTAGSTTISAVTNMQNWLGSEGQPIYGGSLPYGATVVSVGADTLTVSVAATGDTTGALIHRWMVFYEAQDESVLALLSKLAEATATHFRLGTGREIVWLWRSRPASGIRAVMAADPVAAQRNPDLCLITGLSVVRDSSELLSHVTPFGATTNGVRLTLADSASDPNRTTRVPPAGYTLDLDANVLGNSAALSDYGYFNRIVTWQNVGTSTDAGDPPPAEAIVSARNQLYDVAFEYLRTHSEPLESYSLTLTKLDREVLPGDTIRVIWRDWIDGAQLLDIDTDLLILESTTEVTADGLLTPSLMVATLDRWPEDDTELLIAMLRHIADARRQTA